MGNCLWTTAFASTSIISDEETAPLAAPSLPSSSSLVSFSRRKCKKDRSSYIFASSECTEKKDISDFYILGSVIGRGQSGIVRLCTSRATGAHFACKSIAKMLTDPDAIAREVHILRRLAAEGEETNASVSSSTPSLSVPLLRQVFEDRCSVHLVLDLCLGGDLFDRITKRKFFSESLAASVFVSIVRTLQLCHRLGIIHRDLKPENILFSANSDSSPVMLVDFGLALEFSPVGQKFSDVAGSTYYIAPEVLRGEYSEEIDIWSAGVILYVMLSGVPPFWGPTDLSILNAIQEGKLEFNGEPWDKVSSSAKDLIVRILKYNPKERLTPSQILEHPWILYHISQTEQCEAQKLVDQIQQQSVDRINHLATFEGDSGSSASTASHPSESRRRDSTTRSIDNQIMESISGHLGSSNSIPIPKIKDYTPKVQLLSSPNDSASPKTNLTEILTTLVAALNEAPISTFQNILQTRLRAGWSCNILTSTPAEQTLLVDSGKIKYLVVHDRQRKRIGWKVLEQKYFQRRFVKHPGLHPHSQCQAVF